MKPYTQKENAALRRLWREEFNARNPEHFDEKRPPGDPADCDDPITAVGPRGYVDLSPDGSATAHGVFWYIFD